MENLIAFRGCRRDRTGWSRRQGMRAIFFARVLVSAIPVSISIAIPSSITVSVISSVILVMMVAIPVPVVVMFTNSLIRSVPMSAGIVRGR
jgi:hypothetical protein